MRFKDLNTGDIFIRRTDGIEYQKIRPQSDGFGMINARGTKVRKTVWMEDDDLVQRN